MLNEPPEDSGGVFGPGPAGGVELLHGLSESIFGSAAPQMVAHGWSVFPQEASGGRRMPGRVHGQTIRWREDHDLSNRRPDAGTLRSWCLQCAGLNVACVFGPASGNTFAVDIDVLDREMSAAIVEIAEEILGPTPFMRVGNAPKIAMIYRHGENPDDLVHSTSRFFADVAPDGTATRSGHGLEILGATKLITFHGRHHKTGQYFRWIGAATPLLDGPDKATLVTPDQVQTFLEAVDARFRFHRGSSFSATAESWQWDEATRMHVPRLALAAGGSPWVEDADGYVIDGREAYLSNLVYQIVRGNLRPLEEAARAGNADLQRFKANAAATAAEKFKQTARCDQRGRWSERELPREVRQKVSRLVDKVARGEIRMQSSGHGKGGAPQADLVLPQPQAAPWTDPELSFVRPNADRKAGKLKGTCEAPAAGSAPLDIPRDRGAIAKHIQDGLAAAFRSFFADVYGAADGEGDDRRARVHVLKAPTGAGKTTRCIRTIAQDQRTYRDYPLIDRKTGTPQRDPETHEPKRGPAPIVMLLPTYANIDELRSRAAVLSLDNTQSDAGLRAEAEKAGLIAENDLDAKLAELRREAINCGLKTMVYSGKLRAGCEFAEKIQMAMDAGVGTSALCRAKVRKKDPAKKKDPGEVVEEVCLHYGSCKAIAQRAEIAEVQVVFMPHSFLSLAIPEELENVRAVIADERIHHLFLHTATFAASSLRIARKPPRLTAREKAQGLQPDDLLSERNDAAAIALEALERRQCPARALFDYAPGGGASDGAAGCGLAKSALRVCSNAIQRDGGLSPLTPVEEVRQFCARPAGRDIREECQFWQIVVDRISALIHDALADGSQESAEEQIAASQDQWTPDHLAYREGKLEKIRWAPRHAKGAWDHRIQFQTDDSANGGTTESIRISWRTSPNWAGVPVLLLDASAAPPIIAKIWGLKEADCVVHDIVEDTGLSLNVKIVAVVNQTFSNSSIAASASATGYERLQAAKNLDNVRRAISAVSALYGHGRVVGGTSIVLREIINRDWACPDNVDWCHYGAMRGLDGFKFHAAAISIGRMEPPTRTIDGLVAALTYDDDEPEKPFDINGDGRDPDDVGQPRLLPPGDQRIRLRSGHVAVLKVPMFPGRWGRLIQNQYREEELLQFVGRLRPVYREGEAPVWFALSSVLPSELVVDDLVHIEDLLHVKPMNLWDAVRQANGIAEPRILAKACPSVFRSEGAAGRAMEEMGFDPSGKEPSRREAHGFASYRWTMPGAGEQVAFVRASAPDREERLRAALLAHLNIQPASLELIWAPDPGFGARARPRAADKVEDRIGPAEGRPAREDNCLDTVARMLLSTPGEIEYHPFSGTDLLFPFAPESGVGAQQVSARTVGAYVALDSYWRDKGGVADDRLMPMLPDIPANGPSEGDEDQAYDHLGATVTDGDVSVAA